MSVFPDTSLTLIRKLVARVTGATEASWQRFFDLYTPAMRRFVECIDHNHDPDDVVQDVYVQLVGLLQEGKYDVDRARFRTFLAMLIRRQLIRIYRHERIRGVGAEVPLDEMTSEPAVRAVQGDALDFAWAQAKHEAAVEHVLNRTALSAQAKSVYRALTDEELPAAAVAKRFGITENNVRQIKFRIEKAIGLIESEYADGK